MAAATALQSSLQSDRFELQPVFEEHSIRTAPLPVYGASSMPVKEEGSVISAANAEPSGILEELHDFQLQGIIPANWAPEVAEMAGRATQNPKI